MSTGPPVPPQKAPTQRSGSWVPLLLGVTALLTVFGMSFAIFPQMTTVVLVLFGIIAAQYFLWGRWLGDLIRREESEAVEDEV